MEHVVALSEDKKITKELIEKVYKISNIDIHIKEMLVILSTKDTKKAFQLILQLVSLGADIKYFIEQLISVLHELLLIKVGVKSSKSNQVALEVSDIKILIELLAKAHGELKYAVLPQLPLELAIIEWGELEEALKSPRQFADSSNASAPAKLGIRPAARDLVKNTAHAKAPRSNYAMGEEIATREVYGTVLGELGNANPRIYVLDGDVKNSTFSQDFKKVHTERFIECFIAEQNMVGVAVGLSRLGKKPFVSTFAAFLTRAFDQIRMASLSKANITFVGSHAGVSIGEDGSSQMGLEDFAMFGALLDSVILHPSDAVSTTALIPELVDHIGISYLRTLRPKTPVLYNAKEKFRIGGSKILRSS